ncbi:PD-(D/E)XK nuclease family protein [Acinetobacter guillouiae]|uniref:PD-(D/E)XK nuclease family protein n=1 Tax=Acinetobacter guillouiae TaxID=106649 RepID=UPI0032B5A4B6
MKEIDELVLLKFQKLLHKSQKYKIEERELTFFDTASKKYHENPTTELLAFFMDSNNPHKLEYSFYNGLTNLLCKLDDELCDFDFGGVIEIVTEQLTQKGKRLDLVIETDTSLILIENKIGHIQNNPFPDYLDWAEKQVENSKKKIIPIVLCLDGKTDQAQWYGISYAQLIESIRDSVAHQILKSPLNKWAIFTTEFLNHLENLYENNEIDMQSVNFIFENLEEIEALNRLKEQAYDEIVKAINLELATIPDFEVGNRRHSWLKTPALRFQNNQWEDSSDIVLNIDTNTIPPTYRVSTYIHNPTREIEKRAEACFRKNYPNNLLKTWHEQGERYWGITWTTHKFDLDVIKLLIKKNAEVLDKVEKVWKKVG